MWKTCYYHAANDCLITVENCIFKTSLPFFKVLYQRLSHRANITAKQNHCRRQYHAAGTSRRRHITPQAHHSKGNKVSLPGDSHVALLL